MVLALSLLRTCKPVLLNWFYPTVIDHRELGTWQVGMKNSCISLNTNFAEAIEKFST